MWFNFYIVVYVVFLILWLEIIVFWVNRLSFLVKYFVIGNIGIIYIGKVIFGKFIND